MGGPGGKGRAQTVIRVLPSSSPLGLTPDQISRIVDHLAHRLGGFALPSVRGRAFRTAIEIRLLDALEILEEERAADLSAALNFELLAGTLTLPPPDPSEGREDDGEPYTSLSRTGHAQQIGRAIRERKLLPFTRRRDGG